MPNHVRNILTVYGPARDVATFVMQSQTPKPKSGDKPVYINGKQCNPNYHENPLPIHVPFDLHGVVPIADVFGEIPYCRCRTGSKPCGHDLEYKAWGVKWGAYDVEEANIIIQEDCATYAFTTANGIPEIYYEKASLAFPRLSFAVSYAGEGPTFGRRLYQNGSSLVHIEGAYTDLPLWDDDNEEESANRQATAVHVFVDTHREWVNSLLA